MVALAPPRHVASSARLPGATGSGGRRAACSRRGVWGRSGVGGRSATVGMACVGDASTGGVMVTGASGASLSQCIAGGAQLGAAQRAAALPHADVCAARRPCHGTHPVLLECLAGVDAVGMCRSPSVGRGGDEARWTVCGQAEARNRPPYGRASARSVSGHHPDDRRGAPTARATYDRSEPAPTAYSGAVGLFISALYKAVHCFF
jgi:hypothetical protein